MSYASFTNSPASTKLPAHSMAGRTIPAGAGKNRMAALLALAASAQFVVVAFAAYSAAVLHHRLVGGSPPDRQHDDDATLPIPSHPLQPGIRHRRRSRWTRCRQPPVHHRSDRNQARFPWAVLFQQKRHGFNNEPIRLLNFRSMTATEDGDNFKPVTRHDPRVTRLGRFIRHTISMSFRRCSMSWFGSSASMAVSGSDGPLLLGPALHSVSRPSTSCQKG